MRISDWSSDVCSSDLMTVGMTDPQLHAFGRSIFWHCPNECADLPALFRMFKRPNVRAEKLLFRISENMLNRGSDIANDTVRHDNHRGAKGVGQEVAKPLFLLQHAELARSIAKVQQRYRSAEHTS